MNLNSATGNFQMESPAFIQGGEIPKKYTCEGSDISPPLEWKNIPVGTKSLVLIVEDPDAPDPKHPKRTWVHWVLYNIPANIYSLAEGLHKLPQGILEGKNDWSKTGYGGACPPIGRHRYFHKLYALDIELPKLDKPTKAELEKSMQGHIIAKTELMGTYQKSP